ncbi:MAG: OmpH family outer membrane protein [Bacteroidetes bacterium]|nr:MAG: OmpH family outer membrane protein [Bacteroidota bacterium]
MKKIFFSLFLMISFASQAQKFAFFNSEKIFEKMPEYTSAQVELEKFANDWQAEIEQMQKEIVAKRLSLEAQKVLVSTTELQQKLSEIDTEESNVLARQAKVFGQNGELYKKRLELLRPVQEKIKNSAQKLAKKARISMVFDISGDLTVVYAEPDEQYNLTKPMMLDLKLISKEEVNEENEKTEEKPSENTLGNPANNPKPKE